MAIVPLAPGDPLPELKGQYLSGGPAAIPKDTRGKVALLAIAFSTDAVEAVASWLRRFHEDFEHHPRVISYDLPMLGGAAETARSVVDNTMLRSMPAANHKHVVTRASQSGAWKKRVGYGPPGFAYLILIDGGGIVRWRHGGAFDEARYQELARTIRGLIAGSAGQR